MMEPVIKAMIFCFIIKNVDISSNRNVRIPSKITELRHKKQSQKSNQQRAQNDSNIRGNVYFYPKYQADQKDCRNIQHDMGTWNPPP